jgi:hypothetical protein
VQETNEYRTRDFKNMIDDVVSQSNYNVVLDFTSGRLWLVLSVPSVRLYVSCNEFFLFE